MYAKPRRLLPATLRALLLRFNPPQSWPSSVPTLVFLLLLTLGVEVLFSMWWDGYPGLFDYSALPAWLCPVMILLLLGQALGPRQQSWAVRLAIMWYALGLALTPLVIGALALTRAPWWEGPIVRQWGAAYGWAVFLVPYAWSMLATIRQLWPIGRRRAVAMGLCSAAALLAYEWYFPRAELWLPAPKEVAAPAQQARRPLPETALFFQQPELLRQSLEQLAPERPGVADTYLISIAGYAGQSVFLREAEAVQQLFDRRYGTRHRSVLLANSSEAAQRIPMANRDSVGATIREMASLMNRDEDLLVVYLTSHGGRNFDLSLDFPDLSLQPITPQWLAAQFKAAGIRWKLVAVSACFSGGYVSALADADSAVVTAADSTHTSFGCSDDEEYTYFGKALFVDALAHDNRLAQAFATARTAIRQREQNEGYEHSNPQLAIGKAFAARFGTLPLTRPEPAASAASAAGG
ncbi:hypothetical protein GCM10007860_23870 [Chitiniphilus shinanonensis]|uniref:Caspase family p20 domain-containing protein n=1 Tax=Chitiniphilus shinanonensis TaxID=553088 RepID=A0ABQ6BV38_9NEIS|nr:C13 family peptidase [Chitiniphilus shinanonensis]GLS05237.1 hypothetical protein GCM10007860_23870 [Chitiniphilus shinanonensis]